MGSREEFDLTEKLIKPGRSDKESAQAWNNENAKIVVIKHGKKGSTDIPMTEMTIQSNRSRLRH